MEHVLCKDQALPNVVSATHKGIEMIRHEARDFSTLGAQEDPDQTLLLVPTICEHDSGMQDHSMTLSDFENGRMVNLLHGVYV